MNKIVIEKHHRLEDNLYESPIAVVFTACIFDRKPVLTNPKIFNSLRNILLKELDKWRFDSQVYLFMPDHLHLLVESKYEGSNALYFMQSFKQKSGYWISQSKLDFRWQKDFYDHVIKNDDDIENQINYILNNPVRKGLANNWKEYPFKGSTVHNLDELD